MLILCDVVLLGDLWIKRPNQEALERIYTGNWKNDLKDGLGVFSYSDGSRYEGNWKTGLRHGQGTLYYPNGNEYVGEWQDGWQNGYGRLTYANEDVYEGDWLNGKREGPGNGHIYCAVSTPWLLHDTDVMLVYGMYRYLLL